MAALFVGAVGTANAQLPYGEECGCPEPGSRTNENLSDYTDGSGNLLANTTLTCDKMWILDETVYVGDGKTITIQAGTIIKGETGTGLAAKSLLISRGGKINAVGSESCPIQFTSVSDPLDGTKSLLDQGEWGGLLILGKATNNLLLANGGLAVGDGVGTIEGFDTSDPRVRYGNPGSGFDDNDNSGVLKYVSLRHGGTVVGDPGLGNDINGLTLGSVGRGTTIEHVEIVGNNDDGIEFFGGTVDVKYISVLFCGDDYFDTDQGWTGRGQFIFGLQAPGQGNEGMECDADDNDSGNSPATHGTIFNATMIGNGANAGVFAKEAVEGTWGNCVFGNFAQGINLDNDRAIDAEEKFANESLRFLNNTFVNVGELFTIGLNPAPQVPSDEFANSGNLVDNNLIDVSFALDANGTTVTDAATFTPAAGTATTDLQAPIDDFFSAAGYRGAFAPGSTSNWLENFSAADAFDLDNSLVSCPSDLNNDGNVNSGDFLIFSGDFGSSCAIE